MEQKLIIETSIGNFHWKALKCSETSLEEKDAKSRPSGFAFNTFIINVDKIPINVPPPALVATVAPKLIPAAPIDCRIATRLPAAVAPPCNDIIHAANDPAAIPPEPNPIACIKPTNTTGASTTPPIVNAEIVKIFWLLTTNLFASSIKV
ncbi:4401_t:CDS:2 [Cetraspora pellucida]|uniref:4401_t:CDS:1 n=1 Tax=Cetraspora pellucida TaxID=1433469 RepID=A0ACA9JYN7_9GLOM|nr:4401_t:CDS:2 [Cetraspora pellucida]